MHIIDISAVQSSIPSTKHISRIDTTTTTIAPYFRTKAAARNTAHTTHASNASHRKTMHTTQSIRKKTTAMPFLLFPSNRHTTVTNVRNRFETTASSIYNGKPLIVHKIGGLRTTAASVAHTTRSTHPMQKKNTATPFTFLSNMHTTETNIRHKIEATASPIFNGNPSIVHTTRGMKPTVASIAYTTKMSTSNRVETTAASIDEQIINRLGNLDYNSYEE